MGGALDTFGIYKYPKDSLILSEIRLINDLEIVNLYDKQVEELKKLKINHEGVDELISHPGEVWAWYPWHKKLINIIEDKEFQKLRTSRNKLLINDEEQKKFENFSVAVAGLSVGNSIAYTIRMQGGSKKMKIADFDTLETSNLNRIRAGLVDVERKKTENLERELLEVDPYSEIISYPQGLSKKNIYSFVDGVQLVFDEVDDLSIKIHIRLACRGRGIPLIMLTDNDDGVLVDYYPYHANRATPLFYGLHDNEVLPVVDSMHKLSKQQMVSLSSKIVGVENISKRMLHSLMEVGKSLYTWPQLGTAALMSGVVGCYLSRKIAVGQEIKCTRVLIRLNDLI